MKRILLTTTSLVMAAGVANAELSWTATGTAGIAREGSAAATTAVAATVNTFALAQSAASLATAASEVTTDANWFTMVVADLNADIDAIDVLIAAAGGTSTTITSNSEATIRADIASLKVKAALITTDAATAINAAIANAEGVVKMVYGTPAVAKASAGDFKTYSEINATVSGAVSLDNGITISAAMSLDAGTGYDFADDDGFDAAKTGGASLDSVSIDMGANGTLTIDPNDVVMLVDADDETNGDIKYTNTFGAATFTGVMDVNTKDTDTAFVAGVAESLAAGANDISGNAGNLTYTAATASTVQDVQWSAKVSMPLAGGTGYIAMDEEGGNAFGATATLEGVGISFDSKLEALDSELKKDRNNTIGLTYAMGATTFGATWNSVEDGDQWGVSAAYAADGLTISASTDEGSDWSVSGSMALGSGASIVAGTNYSEDAYVGVSFAF